MVDFISDVFEITLSNKKKTPGGISTQKHIEKLKIYRIKDQKGGLGYNKQSTGTYGRRV